MKYQVTVHSSNNIQVGVPRVEKKRLIDVDTTIVSGGISDLDDVDTTNKQNNSILIWNSTTEKHEYVSAFEILDRADGIDDDAIDYGTY